MNTLLSHIMLFVLIFLFSGCGSDSGTDSQLINTENPIDWTASSVIYSDAPGKKAHSMLFMSASWCTFCKQMKSDTFNDSAVVEILMTHFNSAEVYGDSDSNLILLDRIVTGYEFARFYNIDGYPTFIFLDSNYNIIGRDIGFKDAKQFRTILSDILSQ